jgi:hypothetical protein
LDSLAGGPQATCGAGAATLEAAPLHLLHEAFLFARRLPVTLRPVFPSLVKVLSFFRAGNIRLGALMKPGRQRILGVEIFDGGAGDSFGRRKIEFLPLLWLSPLACSLSSEGRIQRRHVCVTSETRDRRRSFTDQFRRISRCAPRQRRQALKLEQEAVRLSALVGHRMACDMNLLLLPDQPRIGIILETAQPAPFRGTQPERREGRAQ